MHGSVYKTYVFTNCELYSSLVNTDASYAFKIIKIS